MKSAKKIKIGGENKYTYDDYCTWPIDQRFELIDGTVYDMTPAPSSNHQIIVVELVRQLANFFHGKTCKVFVAPFDVRFPEKNERDEEIKNVVQPDVVVICDPQKLDEKGCRGAPDLVIEVISPSTASKDHLKKKRLFECHGVKEYWLIDPQYELATIYRQSSKGLFNLAATLGRDETLECPLFESLKINFSSVFPPPPPKTVKESTRKFSKS